MKKLHQPIFFLTLLFVVFTGCNDYLSKTPDNRVDLNTTEKAAQLLTNAYTNASYNFTEWMGDDVSYTLGTTKLPEHNQAYQWEDIFSINQDTPGNFWTSTYDAIAHSNEVLAVVDNLPGDQAQKDAVKGEALLTRAYGHFMLVNLFAEHYDPDNADSQDGIPYVLKPETEFIQKYSRNSVQEVYDLAEEDIKNGLELVDGSFYRNSGKYHFTKNAALALASRLYLFKGDWDNCILYSKQMLGADPSVYMKDLRTYLAEYTEATEFLRLYTSPDDPSNLLLTRVVSNYHVNVGYWPSPSLGRSIFGDNPWNADDVRFSDRYPIFVRGENNWAFGKYEFLFERSSLTSNVGLNYTIDPVFRAEEVLLNLAEAYVYKAKITEAVDILQVLIDARYEEGSDVTQSILRNYYQTSNTQSAVLQFILDERRKEFIHEGLRWFDIKRYQMTVSHTLQDNSVINLEANDVRKVLQIPQAAIDVGGLNPNPR
jgi:hypothetical protein